MHPSVGFAFQARGYASKGRRFLSDAPLVGFPSPWPAAFDKSVLGLFSFTFLLKSLSKNVRFGRSLAQLVLVALSLYPFSVKEKLKTALL